ncbi:hypothetical protein BDV27DRAFT_147903 [Aspergillus caelatus]|uniref:Uncharacterized protein n=1 Tax=Aspergillus caelatus TaxID=61420 RepID=A0A5N6ZUU0_9EURO|nr:uncharacterized protein BDV27DRAFT_147903 [Aspergillus caelatus]KAE8361337.1 hypothetical protein BDV27DRAFT_147903 [Aspergillus caelatus]
MYSRQKQWERVFLGRFVLVEWVSWFGRQSIHLPVSYSTPTQLTIFIFCFVYEVILSLVALDQKHDILMIALCVCNTCNFVFSVLGYRDQSDLVEAGQDIWPRVRPPLIAISVVVGVSTCLMWISAFQLHRDFAWSIYRRVNGDAAMKTRYLNYQIYMVFIALDFQVFVAFVLQYNIVVVHYSEPEFGLTMAMLPASLLILLLAVYSARSESRILTGISIIGYIAGLTYVLVQLIVLCTDDYRSKTDGNVEMLLCGFIAMILISASLILAVKCMVNFDRGLKSVFLHDQISCDFHMVPSPSP